MPKRSLLQYLLLTFKGMAMGAADVVPGVSGGTIAFISGIYEELIESINRIGFGALRVWKKDGFKAAWNYINGTFFVFLFGGIAISIVTLAKVVTHFLETHPVLLWSFFFGLIIASVWLISKSITKWSIGTIISLIIGTGVAYYITTIHTVADVDAYWFVVLSGALAICAMILPGISGAFILLLLGSYDNVLSAINERDLVFIGLFALGCLIGLLTFARVLKYLFAKFKNITIALLTGFMIGSLNKVWPWKKTLEFRVNSHGESVPFIQENVVPGDFKGDAQFWFALGCLVVGFLVIFILERFAPKKV
ncbi:MAG: putative membrane protein [Crocinitomicaceae bacterium]|jgi:putative membrane protein